MRRQRTSTSNALILIAICGLILGASAASAGQHTVTISGGAFVPPTMKINAGDTVTWINDGGSNNVVADDGSFASGPPSTDLWQLSHTFWVGGTYTYRNQSDGSIGTIGVGGLFGDGFEIGSTEAWDLATPGLPYCHCYFSGDCAAGFCDWSVLSAEDTCLWREVKPDNVPGAGCNVPYLGVGWTSGICDGLCSATEGGSRLGWEDKALLAQGVELWAEAILRPAELGGGPVDPALAEQALKVGFNDPNAATTLGRQVADILTLAHPGFYKHFCHHEGHPDDPLPSTFVDLSQDTCRRTTARQVITTLLAELRAPGSSGTALNAVTTACPDWQRMFMPRCAGENTVACVQQRVADLATFLTTPRAYEQPWQKVLREAGLER